jgi:hypothetical protein
MRLRSALLFVLILVAAPASAGPDRTVQKVRLRPSAGAGMVEVWLTRARGAEGALTVKLFVRGLGPKAQALTLYEGGGGDDGPGDDDLKALDAAVLEVGGKKLVRVDFAYHPPDGRKGDERTDTFLVGFEDKPVRLAQLVTRKRRTRSKLCKEREETRLVVDAAGNLLAETRLEVDPELGDDDEPLDRRCVAPPGVKRTPVELAAKAPAEDEEGED